MTEKEVEVLMKLDKVSSYHYFLNGNMENKEWNCNFWDRNGKGFYCQEKGKHLIRTIEITEDCGFVMACDKHLQGYLATESWEEV